MSEHAKFAPSSAHRWVACPGTIRMSEGIVEPESESALEGTIAHEVAECTLQGKPIRSDATDEMIDGAIMYAEYIISVIGKEQQIHIEERVNGVHPENWGTPDAYTLTDTDLHIFDYKFGRGIVDPYRNWQLLNYAAGIIGKTPDITIHLHIVQPRAYHRDGTCRSWSIISQDAFTFFMTLSAAVTDALKPNAKCFTGTHCEHCTGRYRCSALLRCSYSIIERSGESLPLEIAVDVMGMLLVQVREGIDRLTAIESGLEQQVLSALRAGARVPGWHIETGAGRERWRVPYAEVVALGDAMGIQVRKDELITPKQSVKAGLPRDLVDSFTEIPSGKAKIVRDDTRLAQVFGTSPSAVK